MPILRSAVPILALVFGSHVFAQVIYVDTDATGANNGSSWCDAFTDLQVALAASQSGTEVRVAGGTYRPTGLNGNRNISFHLVNDVAILGGFAGCGAAAPDERDFILHETVLSGDLNGDDDQPPSTCCTPQPTGGCDTPSCQSAICSIDPFCCSVQWDGQCASQAGNLCSDICYDALQENTCRVVVSTGVLGSARLEGFTISNGQHDYGCTVQNKVAGIAVGDGSPTIRDCLVRDNTGLDGGGMWVGSGNPLVERCTFFNNYSGNGGAVLVYEEFGPPNGGLFKNCTFLQNKGSNGAILVGNSRLVLEGCQFFENEAPAVGIVGVPSDVTTIRNSVFQRNYGAAVLANLAANPLIVDSVFVDNLDVGVRVGANVRIFNCTFVANGNSGVSIDSGGTLTIRNSLLWQNDDGGALETQQLESNGQPFSIGYSCIQGWTGSFGGIGNFGDDPLFLDAPGGDYHLDDCSPCVNAGDPNFVALIGETDIDGEPRVIGVRVDIGADEVPHVDANMDGVPDQCVSGACCEPDGSCTVTVQAACSTSAWTEGGSCSPSVCPFIGACCPPSGTCFLGSESNCDGGLWTAGGACAAGACIPAPMVIPLGPRYLQISLSLSTGPVAIKVTSPDESCLNRFVAFDSGQPILIDNPVYLSPPNWGTVILADDEIAPDTTYFVQVIDGTGASAHAVATTFAWADVDNSSVTDLDDLICVLLGIAGDFSVCAVEALDLMPCDPDGVVDLDDLLGVLQGFTGDDFPCPPICP